MTSAFTETRPDSSPLATPFRGEIAQLPLRLDFKNKKGLNFLTFIGGDCSCKDNLLERISFNYTIGLFGSAGSGHAPVV